MRRDDVNTHVKRIFEFVFQCLSFNDDLSVTVDLATTLREPMIEAVVVLVMKLSENQFKPFFTHLCSWAEAKSVGKLTKKKKKKKRSKRKGNVEEDEDSSTMVLTRLSRRTVVFHTAARLVERLKSIFVSYFMFLAESMGEALEQAAVMDSEQNTGDDSDDENGFTNDAFFSIFLEALV